MSEAIVFVTQVPNRRDGASGMMVPVFDVSPAAEHGTIEQILPPSASFFNTVEMVKQIRNRLSDYRYERGDSILLAGDPIVIGTACAIAAENGRRHFKFLKWERSIGRYVPVEVHL